jgi:hypothetical protein
VEGEEHDEEHAMSATQEHQDSDVNR